MTKVIISGKKRICNFVGRSWLTVERWIREEQFPARKIDGIWESDSELITTWKKSQIIGLNMVPIEPENGKKITRKKPVKSKR